MKMRSVLEEGLRIMMICLSVTGAVHAACNMGAVTNCAGNVDFSNTKNMCEEVTKLKKCIAPYTNECEGDQGYQTVLQNFVQFGCDGETTSDKCNILGLQTCMMVVDMGKERSQEETCSMYPTFKECWDPLAAKCGDNAQFKSMEISISNIDKLCGTRNDQGGESCSTQAVTICIQKLTSCGAVSEYEKCIAPYSSSCQANPTFIAYQRTYKSLKSSCGGIVNGACDGGKVQECMKDLDMSALGQDPSVSCPLIEKLSECLDKLKTECENDPSYKSSSEIVKKMDPICTKDGCNLMNLQTCMAIVYSTTGSRTEPTVIDPSQMCSNYTTFKSCWDQHATSCENNDQAKRIIDQVKQLKLDSICTSGCEFKKLLACAELVSKDLSFDAFPTAAKIDDICRKSQTFDACVTPLIQPCSKVEEENFKQGVQSINFLKSMFKIFCDTNTKTGFQKYATCFKNATVSAAVDMCHKKYSKPPADKDGMPKDETDQEQCKRLKENGMCFDKAVTTCGEETTTFTVTFTSDVIRTLMRNEKLDCGTSAAYILTSSMWVSLGLVAFFLFL